MRKSRKERKIFEDTQEVKVGRYKKGSIKNSERKGQKESVWRKSKKKREREREIKRGRKGKEKKNLRSNKI